MAMDSKCDFEQSHPPFSGEAKDAATSLMEELDAFLEQAEEHFHINVDSSSAEDKFIEEHFEKQIAKLYSETERQRKPSGTFARPQPVHSQCQLKSKGFMKKAQRQKPYHNNVTSNNKHVTSSNRTLSSSVNLNMVLFQTVQQKPEYYSSFSENSSCYSHETKSLFRH